ncbi:hypothetical protein APA22_40100 (plasmid) [Acetobacter pasteurianus IFO 3283-22]|uniref:Uncharacterized protein n=2 Tax=Acetobacter pasteurianus TaxID=438 RepID=C7JI71_ACEP3|nr:hypothetical protein APA01_40100 [Acetobacter pasteurianus IFO 3283-01]BAI03846.1 hypothetical protein APA03_40100 [Acetobacter pasteurianus IFO 3283-03]BAI06893.1 hypothetical protein APA07_40100 [Acetobacter pasteurianus IFO 3283-07]BAI09941.1 hypothetical protein APA22_40100 [Acetobacter pasteurianus IFO 3283-22]BAI12989.1 hypothetical protein APA26_40100 [Acetobacter pasteurianus IFO 3283-26]BAI16035.1 hypothetical protein APA32_40100 [Acetobacter pasteurianus IFO 3283-32]BAI19019.1 hy
MRPLGSGLSVRTYGCSEADDQENDGWAKKDTGEIVALYEMSSPVMPSGLVSISRWKIKGCYPKSGLSRAMLCPTKIPQSASNIALLIGSDWSFIEENVFCNHIEWQTCLPVFVMNLDHPA